MTGLLSSIWGYIRRNKYKVSIVAFLLIIVFLDENNLIRRISQKRQIRAMEEEIDMYNRQILEGKELLENLENDSMLLEHIAREKYNMSRPDEDVFIIE